MRLGFFRISAVTGEGVKELVEAAWPIIAEARDAEAAAIVMAAEEEEERIVPNDYNPALMPPLRGGGRKK